MLMSPRNMNKTPSITNDISMKNDDCFVKFGFISSIEQNKTSKIEIKENDIEQDQPAKLVENIDAITALLIYHSFSKKHRLISNHQYSVSSIFERK